MPAEARLGSRGMVPLRWQMTGWSCYGLLTFLHKGGASFSWEVFPLTATNEHCTKDCNLMRLLW